MKTRECPQCNVEKLMGMDQPICSCCAERNGEAPPLLQGIDVTTTEDNVSAEFEKEMSKLKRRQPAIASTCPPLWSCGRLS